MIIRAVKIMKGTLIGMVGLVSAFATSAVATETILSVTQISYDANQRPLCTTLRMNPTAYGAPPSDACALGAAGSFGPDRITKTVYDAAGEVKQVIQAYGTANQRVYATYNYNTNGKVVDSIDANGNRTHMVYDGFDRLVTLNYPSTTVSGAFNESDPDSALASSNAFSTSDYETYVYDANGNRTSWRRRNGAIITDCYDALNRTTIEIVSGATCATANGAADVFTGYDLQGHVLKRAFASLSGTNVSYQYDALGRVTSTTDANARTLGYGYNAASARTSLTYPDSVAISSTRDNLNRLTSAQLVSTGAVLYSQTFENNGNLFKMVRGHAANTVAACQDYETCWHYDALGRVSDMTLNPYGVQTDTTWTFTRNPAGQLASWFSSNSIFDYTTSSASTDNRTYDGLNRDASIAGISGGYDANGNLTSEGAGGRTMTYDVFNRLLTVTGTVDGVSVNVKLTYDPEGRLAKYSNDGGTTWTTYLYDGTSLVGEYDNSGVMQERYLDGDGTDDPIIWYHGSGTSTIRYFLRNYQGSIVAYTSASDSRAEYYDYGPYGEPQVNGLDSWTGGATFRYTGQTILRDAHLYYYKARVYDPKYGRFLQTDPIGSKDDLDLYAYTGDDPVNKSDSEGTAPPDNMIPGKVAHKMFTIKARSFFGQYYADYTIGRVGGDPRRPRPDLIEFATKSIYELKSVDQIPEGTAEAKAYSDMTGGKYTPGEVAPRYFEGNIDVVPLSPGVDIVYTFVGNGVITYQYRDNPEREAKNAQQVQAELSVVKNVGIALVTVAAALATVFNPLTAAAQ